MAGHVASGHPMVATEVGGGSGLEEERDYKLTRPKNPVQGSNTAGGDRVDPASRSDGWAMSSKIARWRTLRLMFDVLMEALRLVLDQSAQTRMPTRPLIGLDC